jgi:Fe-S-cluster containining protein
MIALSRSYASREGAPVIDRVDERIFTLKYFRHCMDCTFCSDSCCQYGADIETPRREAIMAEADALEAYLGVPRTEWFRLDPDDVGLLPEPDYPGGEYTRTAVVELPIGRSPHNSEACVFLDPQGRGCRLHTYALNQHRHPNTLKPMVCVLFPVSFALGCLEPAIEFEHSDLICAGTGESVYRGARTDLIWYFGADFVAELDRIESRVLTMPSDRMSSQLPMAMQEIAAESA